MRSRRAFLKDGAAGVAALHLASGTAQEISDFPSRPVTIISTSQAGGGLDLLARTVSERLAGSWQQAVLVEPRPGANGMIAAAAVAKARPDGHTLLITNSSVVQNTILYRNAPYRLNELAPISQVVQFPIALAVRSDIGIGNVAQLMALAKQRPGKLSLGSYGAGSSGHLLGETLKREADVFILHVPYRGEPAMVAAMLSGEIDGGFASVGGLARQVPSGKVRLIAVASTSRLKDFPDVPTFAEAGFPAVSAPGWGGVFAPAGIKAEIAGKIATEISRIMQAPEVVARVTGSLGALPLGSSPAAFSQLVEQELAVWTATIKRANISLD